MKEETKDKRRKMKDETRSRIARKCFLKMKRAVKNIDRCSLTDFWVLLDNIWAPGPAASSHGGAFLSARTGHKQMTSCTHTASRRVCETGASARSLHHLQLDTTGTASQGVRLENGVAARGTMAGQGIKGQEERLRQKNFVSSVKRVRGQPNAHPFQFLFY